MRRATAAATPGPPAGGEGQRPSGVARTSEALLSEGSSIPGPGWGAKRRGVRGTAGGQGRARPPHLERRAGALPHRERLPYHPAMRAHLRQLGVSLCLAALVGPTAACSHKGVDSDEEARRAYLGLDLSVEKSLELGFDGFNSASSANIAPQTASGEEAGTLTVTGQVDQGSSDNKGMRLYVGMVDYSDGDVVIDDEGHTISLTYDTDADPAAQPYLQLSLRNIPDGTLSGTLTGTYHIRGDIAGDATVDLTFEGTIQDDGTGKVVRTPGATHVTGTVTSGNGIYDVDVTI
jgi:hypothetical protein